MSNLLTLSFADFNVPFSMRTYTSLGQHYSTNGGTQYLVSCGDGKVKTKVVSEDSVPFQNTGVSVEGQSVTITFSAYSKFRKVSTMNAAIGADTKNGYACKDSYVSGEVLGGIVYIQDSFTTDSEESAQRLAQVLKRYTSLSHYQGFSVKHADSSIVLRGRGAGYGGTISKEQRSQLNDALFGIGDKSLVQVADEIASTLDANFPAERVAKLVRSAPVNETADFGQVIYYTISPIKK